MLIQRYRAPNLLMANWVWLSLIKVWLAYDRGRFAAIGCDLH
jgi:hypothetical protein